MKFRNCTKSGKVNAEIFSELAWNIFRIFFRGQFGVFWQFRFFFPEIIRTIPIFFPEVIQSIRTIPNFFLRSIWIIRTIPIFFLEFRIICGKYMEIYQNPLFFHENIFFLIRKSLNTPNSIFRPNIRNLLLRVYTIITGSVNNWTCMWWTR
jgi:hypothetical protein